MAENRSGSSGAFLAGLLIGGAVGAIAGILLAPRSGRETRQILKKSADALPELAEDLSSSMQVQTDRLSGSALRNWDNTLVRLKEAIRAGAQAAGLETSPRDRQPPATSDPRPASEQRPVPHDPRSL